MTTNVRSTFSVGDTTPWFTIRIGGTKYKRKRFLVKIRS